MRSALPSMGRAPGISVRGIVPPQACIGGGTKIWKTFAMSHDMARTILSDREMIYRCSSSALHIGCGFLQGLRDQAFGWITGSGRVGHIFSAARMPTRPIRLGDPFRVLTCVFNRLQSAMSTGRDIQAHGSTVDPRYQHR